MKIFFAAFSLSLAALVLTGCVSTKRLYDMKSKGLSAPSQNTVRVCNMLTWVYNTCEDFDDMNEMLKEIGITREELQTMKFNGNYEKPFGRKFSVLPDNSEETEIYSDAKKQARKIARLMLKKLPPEGDNSEEEE